MTVLHSVNLKLPYPDSAEHLNSAPQEFQNFATVLDAGANGPTAMLWQKGVLASKPAASTVPIGGVYHCTDVACMFISDGASWHYVPLDGNAQPVGTVQSSTLVGDPVDPDGVTRWLVCDGRAISRNTYSVLYGLISTQFGVGDGSTTFNVPDCRGRVPVGANPTGANGLSVRTLAQSGGEETHTLVSGEVPSHTHTIQTDDTDDSVNIAKTGVTVNKNYCGLNGSNITMQASDPLNTWDVPVTPNGSLQNAWAGSTAGWAPLSSNTSWYADNASHNHALSLSDSGHDHTIADPGHSHRVADPGHSHGGTTSAAGSGFGHNNMQPYTVLNYVIKVQ